MALFGHKEYHVVRFRHFAWQKRVHGNVPLRVIRRANYPSTLFLSAADMRFVSRDQINVCSAFLKQSAEHRAHCACAVDCNFHSPIASFTDFTHSASVFPSISTVISAYFSYKGTRSLYISKRVNPSFKTTPRAAISPSRFRISS